MTDTSENRGIIAGGDVRDANLINVGDVPGSYNAMGDGAQVIVQQVQTISPVEERRKAMRLTNALLADAIEAKVGDYMNQLAKNKIGSSHNPYKSLRAYRLVDAPYFYGREDAITEMLDHIHQSPLTILYAASGAGKSSLLQAGLMSRLLAAGHLPLYVRTKMHAGGQMERLDLATLIKVAFLPDVATDPDLATFKNMSLLSFLTNVSQNLGNSTLYIFLDQFEDFFNDAVVHPTLRVPFIKDLNACLDEAGLDVRWVLSLRKEYFADLNSFRSDIFYNRVLLSGLSADDAQQVITEPARQRNVTYEEGVIPQILSDLGAQEQQSQVVQGSSLTQPADLAPTQIQLICHTLFDELEQNATMITSVLYNQPRGQRQLRGAEGILTGHLRSVLDRNLPKENRQLASFILIELVTSQNKRIPRQIDDLMSLLQLRQVSANKIKVQQTLDVLAHHRLLETDEDKSTYELTHDYLVNEIEMDIENRNRKAAQELLEQEVVTYEQFGTLLDGQKFNIINDQRDFLYFSSEYAAELLDKSQEELERQHKEEIKRLRQRMSFIIALFVLSSIIAGILAIEPLQRAYWKYSATNAVSLVDIPELSVQFEAYEVTNERYAWCVSAGACSETDFFRQDRKDKNWENTKKIPVRGVNTNQAMAFCEWVGRTLPTAEQWIQIAPPIDTWKQLEPNQALFCRGDSTCQDIIPDPIGDRTIPQYFIDASKNGEGIFDLVGSVYEWTRTTMIVDDDRNKSCQNLDTIDDEIRFVTLGDSYYQYPSEVGNYNHTGESAIQRTAVSPNIGIRCVSSNKISTETTACPAFK